MDDAGVVAFRDDAALVQTIDVFPPVVDDPFWFGRIAAANALSDVYAMGARPLTAVNFVAYPLDTLGGEPLQAILNGAFDALKEADCAMAGGHSIADTEIKFGLAVTGVVHPDRIVTNSGARAGDQLVLSKPLGLGCLTTALKQGKADDAAIDAGHRIMGRLNRSAAEAMLRHGAHAATDITGFGLSGHTYELAEGAGLSAVIDAASLPLLPEVLPYLNESFTCGGSNRNQVFAAKHIEIADSVPQATRIALFDVQTSGGLLIAVPAAQAEELVSELRANGDTQACRIGEMVSSGPRLKIH